MGSCFPQGTNLTHLDTQGLLYMGRKTDGHGVEVGGRWWKVEVSNEKLGCGGINGRGG